MGTFKTTTRASVILAFLCGAYLVFSTAGCGGGSGGGGGVTVADAGGMWQGPGGIAMPTGMLMAAPMPTGFDVDMNGTVSNGTGALMGLMGQLTLRDQANRVYTFVGTDDSMMPVQATVLLDPDTNHLLYIDQMGRLAALQKNGPAMLPMYMDSDLVHAMWSGAATEATPGTYDPNQTESVATVAVDMTPTFMAGASTGPINVFGTTAEVRGMFMDPGPPMEMGAIVALMTPDKTFLAIFSCTTGGAFPGDCGYTALNKP